MPVGSYTRATIQANVSDDGYDGQAILMFVVPGPNGGGDRRRESAWTRVEFLRQEVRYRVVFFATLDKVGKQFTFTREKEKVSYLP
jgi:hypothetical protein